MNHGAEPALDRPGYDIIGDVHGHVERLEQLLTELGYARNGDGVHHHPRRTAVFVGDLIDGKPGGQLSTLRLVKAMCDSGAARMVLGNHEFNAVAYATVDAETLDYCRPHSEKNAKQHREFLEEVAFGSPLHDSIIEWFCTLPLWLDLDGVRVVHACWSHDDIEHLAGVLDQGHTLNEATVRAGSTKHSTTYQAIENVLKGPEISIDGHYYFDKSGHRREHARVKWWDSDATTLDQVAIVPGSRLHDEYDREVERLPATPVLSSIPRYTGDVPVIVGHYWNEVPLRREHERVVCVDYSAGRGGPLVAYRWSGEQTLVDEHLVKA